MFVYIFCSFPSAMFQSTGPSLYRLSYMWYGTVAFVTSLTVATVVSLIERKFILQLPKLENNMALT